MQYFNRVDALPNQQFSSISVRVHQSQQFPIHKLGLKHPGISVLKWLHQLVIAGSVLHAVISPGLIQVFIS